VNGPQKLRVWLAVNKVTMDVFAAGLGTSGAAVSRWANGVNMPGRHWREQMRQATLGYIDPPDWLREEGALPGLVTRRTKEPAA
jgi:hypothetical protein